MNGDEYGSLRSSGSSGGYADASSKIVKGTGESKKCYEMVSKFLKEGGPKAPGQYFVPPVRGQFIAIENFGMFEMI